MVVNYAERIIVIRHNITDSVVHQAEADGVFTEKLTNGLVAEILAGE